MWSCKAFVVLPPGVLKEEKNNNWDITALLTYILEFVLNKFLILNLH